MKYPPKSGQVIRRCYDFSSEQKWVYQLEISPCAKSLMYKTPGSLHSYLKCSISNQPIHYMQIIFKLD